MAEACRGRWAGLYRSAQTVEERLAREDAKHSLDDFLRMMGFGLVPERDGMDHVNMAAIQCSEGLLGFVLGAGKLPFCSLPTIRPMSARRCAG